MDGNDNLFEGISLMIIMITCTLFNILILLTFIDLWGYKVGTIIVFINSIIGLLLGLSVGFFIMYGRYSLYFFIVSGVLVGFLGSILSWCLYLNNKLEG